MEDISPFFWKTPVKQHRTGLLGRLVHGEVLRDQCSHQRREIRRWDSSVYPFIANNLIPIATGDLCILNAQYEKTLVSRVCQDEAYPLLGEMCVSILVRLLGEEGGC